MKDPGNATGADATRNGDDVSTDPALSSHTFTGSADRVALRITPAHGDAPPGAVEIIDAASMPVGTTAPQAEIVVRQVYPDTVVPAKSPPLPPGPLPLAHAPGRARGGNSGLSRWAWFGIATIAAIVVGLLAAGFLILQSLGRTTNTALPAASAPALVGAPASPATSPTPTLAPLPSPVPTAVPLTSTLAPPTETPLPTSVPTATPTPAVIATVAPTTVPDIAPTVAPPTSVPATSPPPPAAAPAASPQGGAIPAAPGSQPAIPALPPGIRLPATIPQVPQLPRKPSVP